MSEEKKIIEPSGYIHPDNVKRLADGETVAFRKKPYAHDGGGIPVFVGTAPVGSEPVAQVAEDFIFFLRKQPNGERWPVGTNLYADPVAAQAQPEQDSIALDRLADYIADTWPMDKKYSIEEICKRLHGMWPGEFMPAEQVDKQTETQGKPVDESPNLQSQKQPVSGDDQFRDATQMIEPSGNSGELPRLPLNDPAAAYRVLHDYGQSCARAALAQSPMVDMTPPATARDRWMYEQGRLAERDPRNPGTLAQQDAALHAEVLNMVLMLEANEWADHCGKSDLGRRLEWAITVLQNRIAELTKSSNQQDADKVQAELLSSLVEIVDAVIASDEEGLIEHSETIIKARAAIDAARKEQE